MQFKRTQDIAYSLTPRRVLIIYGPRRVGKTTLLQGYIESLSRKKVLSLVGDDFRLRELFGKEIRDDILEFVRPYDVIAIDEAQQVPSIGLGVKMIIDAYPEKNIILTGSSSFDLSSKIGEPLTGRHFTLTLFPIALGEYTQSAVHIHHNLEKILVYGSYPEVLLAHTHEQRVRILNELVSSYLYKDVLALDKIKSPDLLRDIARAVAFQVGNEVSLNEIGKLVSSDVKTVARYLDLLEKMFVIRKVRGFSRNLRNEISQKAKYYFVDTGIRNAVIGQFNSLTERSDVGALWENFMYMELVKMSNLSGMFDQLYFWRTHSGKEIDIIQEHNGKIIAYECKFTDSNAKEPLLWKETYPNSTWKVLSQSTYRETFFPQKRG
jgi:uncharacterized protein